MGGRGGEIRVNSGNGRRISIDSSLFRRNCKISFRSLITGN